MVQFGLIPHEGKELDLEDPEQEDGVLAFVQEVQDMGQEEEGLGIALAQGRHLAHHLEHDRARGRGARDRSRWQECCSMMSVESIRISSWCSRSKR